MKRTLFPNDFAPYYPKGISPCSMYVDVANRIYECIKHINLGWYDAQEVLKHIAINVAIYYEDKMSGIGIWNAFVSMHKRMYGRVLPFVDDELELPEEDVHVAEVQTLIWIVLSRYKNDQFINPIMLGKSVANSIMEILTEDDEVDINDALYDFIYDEDRANDYFKLKYVLFWLFSSYLHCHPLTESRYDETLGHYYDLYGEDRGIYQSNTIFSTFVPVGPLAVLSHLWLAEMYANQQMSDEAAKLRALEARPLTIYEVMECGKDTCLIRDPEGNQHTLRDDNIAAFKKNKYLLASLVRYDGDDWQVNGMSVSAVEEAYKELCEQVEKQKKDDEAQYQIYVDRLKGKRFAYFESRTQLKDWIEGTLGCKDAASQYQVLPAGSQVLFISQRGQIYISSGVVHAIQSEDNPYFDQCDRAKVVTETLEILINYRGVHPEMMHYLIENKMLPKGDISSRFPSAEGNQIFIRNMDFIARHYRRHLYDELL